jgi:hypothetical protein
MPKLSKFLLVTLLLWPVAPALAQVLAPSEIGDGGARQLQQSHMSKLQAIAAAVEGHKFAYPFYLSRVLDVEQKQMAHTDQRSIRFDRFNDQMLLMVTGNYYVSYAADQVNANERVHKTMDEVVRPMLRAAVPLFVNDDGFDGYAFEIAYHVRNKVMGSISENAENVVFVFPRNAAQHFIRATNDEQLQAALMEGQVFLNAEPFNLWVFGEKPSDQEIQKRRDVAAADRKPKAERAPGIAASALLAQPDPSVASELIKPPAMPMRIVLPRTLSDLKLSYASKIGNLQQQLNEQAHYVSYAPPDFIGFHQAIFLEFSVDTNLDAAVSGSRYKLAALAFDDHISHLIRPTLAYFQNSTDFDGLVFSTTIRQPGKSNSEAVEFFFPFSAIKCYAQYDCSGQQLIDSSFVLINGERVTLNLQIAEADQIPAQP